MNTPEADAGMNTQKEGREMWKTEQKIKARKLGPKSRVPKLDSMSDADTSIGMFKILAQLVFDSGGS